MRSAGFFCGAQESASLHRSENRPHYSTELISIEVIMHSNESTKIRGSFPKLLFAAANAAVALLLTLPVVLHAQTAGEGTISGTVTDTTGAVVPGATVTATNLATSVSFERTSSSSGLFSIAPLPPGTYA